MTFADQTSKVLVADGIGITFSRTLWLFFDLKEVEHAHHLIPSQTASIYGFLINNS